MLELLTFIVEEPPPDADQKRGHKYPFIACELLASESTNFLNRLVEDSEAMDYFFSLLSRDSLNLTLAGYFSKAFGACMNRCCLKLLEYLFGEHKALQDMVKHVQSKSIADALLRVMCVDEDIYVPQRRLLLEALMDLLSVENYAQLSSVTSMVIELTQRCGDMKIWTQVILPLATETSLQKIQQALLSGSDLRARAALTLLNSLLSNPKFLELPDPTVLSALLESVVPGLESILTSASPHTLPMTYGQSAVCLGETKLRCLELAATLYRLGKTVPGLTSSRIPELALSFFIDFPWNSFLHHACLQLVQAALSGDASQQLAFLMKTHLPEKIAALGLTETLSTGQTMRKGSVGFATRMAQLIQRAGEVPEIASFLEKEEGWSKYLAEVLQPILKVESLSIGTERKPSEETPSESELDRLTADVDVSPM